MCLDILESLFWDFWEFLHYNVVFMDKSRMYYKEDGGAFS
jgi:hypothetical protein